MNRRSLIVLLGVLVALAALAAIGLKERAPSSSDGVAILPGLTEALNDLERVSLVKAGGEAVATLERRGDDWVVTERSGYPAAVAKLRLGLRALADAKILETKTANPEFYDRLGVADVADADAGGVAVTLTANGAELPTVILGNAEGARYRYARRADEAQSYLLDKNPDFPRSISQWLEPQIIDVRGDRVQQVTIKHPDGETLTVSKAARDAQNFDVAGVPEGRELLYAGVANVIGNSLRELNLEDVEPTDANPAEQPVQVEFRTFDGLVITMTGAERGDDAWVSFVASFDPEQAARFAPAADAAAEDGSPETPADASAADGSAEADRINERVGAWRYKIAGFQYDQMTRRMADLTKPPA
jgi:hypothetical protein